MAIGDALIQAQKCVPRLVVRGIADDTKALPGESPYKRIGKSRAKHSGVAHGRPFAVVGGSLLGSIAREERSSRIAQILQGAAPEQQVPAVGGEPVIHASDKNVVIQAGTRPENKAGIVETITGSKIVGYSLPRAERLIQITSPIGVLHGGINANTSWVE